MTQDADRATLEATMRRFGHAWAHGDVTTLEILLSPTYTHTDIFGEIQDRSAWLAYVQGRRGAKTRVAFDWIGSALGGVAQVLRQGYAGRLEQAAYDAGRWRAQRDL